MTGAAGAAPLVYIITDRHATGGRALGDVVAAALRGLPRRGGEPIGTAVAVQLREKDLEGRALLDLGRTLRGPTAEAGVRLFVNDRVDVALAAGADGVHLGGGAFPPREVRALAPHLQIAVSTHGAAELANAAAAGLASFAVFGPVFDTPSKRGLGSAQGLDRLHDACAAAPGLPVLALGGVDVARAADCLAAGAAGVACIRPILSAADPAAALAGILAALGEG